MMMFSQYCRIESAAGGVICTDREFIRCARALLSDKGRSREQRDARHAWLRDGLQTKKAAFKEYCDVVSGRVG